MTLPFSMPNPVGLFIQPLTAITISDPVMPVITTGMPQAKWSFGLMRSQPYT